MSEFASIRLARWAFWIFALAVLVFSLVPAPPSSLPTTGWDKSDHFLAFAVLSFLGRKAFPSRTAWTVWGLLGFGASIEVLQSFTPTRVADWRDLVADAGGLSLAPLWNVVLRARLLSSYPTALLRLPRPAKRAIAALVDACLCALTVWIALSLRLGDWVMFGGSHWLVAAVSIAVALPVFWALGLYGVVFRYGAGLSSAIWHAGLAYAILFCSLFTVIGIDGVPKTIGLIQPPILMLAVYGSRALARQWLGNYRRPTKACVRARDGVLIYGAGSAGQQLAEALAETQELRLQGFLDDDPHLHGSTIRGWRIYSPQHLAQRVRELDVSTVLLAIPSAPRKRRNEILQSILKAHVSVRTLPGLMDLAYGRVQASDLREPEIADLLGRDTVAPCRDLLDKNIADKVVLVTGAGGSIGSELCRQIVKSGPETLLLVDQSEYALYAIHAELAQLLAGDQLCNIRLVPLLASVREEARMREIMGTWRPHTVYHAAAYKHVPLVEHNAAEGVKNNVYGTLVTARAAAEVGVDDFVLVSTDKAVRPTNIMGTSKRVAEMALQALAERSARTAGGTRFCMVRFGNVLGSSGSVVPLFLRQIAEGGPITLTHAEITRYFMTIPEAAQLVIQAGAMAAGGDVFVLDMGEPVKIIDLARRMIELSGLTVCNAQNPEGDIAIRITGLRPGEKLYEELLIGDSPLPTGHPRIMRAHEEFLPWEELSVALKALMAALRANDVPQVRDLLQRMVQGYRPTGELVDWVHMEQARQNATMRLSSASAGP